MASEQHHTWDIWYPEAGARGLSFARGRMKAAGQLLVHAAPEVIAVDVRDDGGHRVAHGGDLRRTAETPIGRLTRDGDRITREDIWPTAAEVGLPVILCGGEIGILLDWWNDEHQQQWRWSIELYNHR